MSNDLTQEMTQFFDDFVSAFEKFDGSLIAKRYAVPYLAKHVDRPTELFIQHAEIAAYFQTVVDSYYQQGCRSCRYKDLEVVALGERCLLSTVTWELLTSEGTKLSEWRESYNVSRDANGLRVFASIDHEG